MRKIRWSNWGECGFGDQGVERGVTSVGPRYRSSRASLAPTLDLRHDEIPMWERACSRRRPDRQHKFQANKKPVDLIGSTGFLLHRDLLSHSRLFFHLLPQAQWTHVGPGFFDVGQAFLFQAALAHGAPALGYGFVVGPDRVLLFVVDHDLKEDVLAVEY